MLGRCSCGTVGPGPINVRAITHHAPEAQPGQRAEATAELRLARVKPLSDRDHVAPVTYLLARYPDTFPKMLDDALSSLSADRDGPARQSG